MTPAIAQPSVIRPLVIRHEVCSTLGLLGRVATQQNGSVRYLDPFQGETLTEAIADYTHLIVLGGAVSAYEDDRYPFLRYEFQLVEAAIAHHIPVVGICLGAQILARVLGAQVYRGEAGREVGWCEIQLTDAAAQDRLLQSFPSTFKVFQSHQDTFDIPAGAMRLAESSLYPNQAFCYRDQVWALQFHLEFDENVVSDCAPVLERELFESGIQNTTLTQLDSQALVANRCALADRFMEQFFDQRLPVIVNAPQ